MLVMAAKAISTTYDKTVDNLHYKYDQYFNPQYSRNPFFSKREYERYHKHDYHHN